MIYNKFQMTQCPLMSKTQYITLVFLFFSLNSFSQVSFSAEHYGFDDSRKIVLCNDLNTPIPPGTTVLNFDKTYTLSTAISGVSAGTQLWATSGGQTYQIYFTNIPIINISGISVNSINRDTEKPAYMKVLDITEGAYSSPIGIRTRGASSTNYPKKSYRVQLKDNNGSNKDTTLFGLREDKRWLMLAMYNEPLRLNNKVSHDLWMKMHKLYYSDLEPDAFSSIRSLYVEAFIDNEYMGVYLFTENLDRKQYKLKKNSGSTIKGELYKGDQHGAPSFDELPSIAPPGTELWGGWEMKYPDYEIFNWDNLYNLTEFVRNSTDSDFNSQISDKFNIDNVIDYFIFLNIIRGTDNNGKNSFIARYKGGEPYFLGVWDLDGTLGYSWMGNGENIVNDLKTNSLFNRLISVNPDNYKHKAAGRWFSLRDNILHTDSLKSYINTQYDHLLLNKAYEREYSIWSQSHMHAQEKAYLLDWLERRANWLDNHFNSWISGCAPPDVSFTPSKIANGQSVILSASGCPGVVKWHTEASGSDIIEKGINFTTPDLYDNTTYYASCTIGSCVSSIRTPVTVSPNCSGSTLNYGLGNQTSAYYASDLEITSSAVLELGHTEYNSGKYIVLLPGFETEADSDKTFNAKIEGCD